MMASKAYRVLVVLLGLWVGLAPALYAAPATAMAVQTCMSDDNGPGECDGCPDGDVERGLCTLMCLYTGQVAITAEPGKLSNELGNHINRVRLRATRGALLVPDPAPPKPPSLL